MFFGIKSEDDSFFCYRLFIWRYLIMNEEKKDIRFIAVDYDDPKVKDLMSDPSNNFVEIDKQY